jgi:hypothetical protein
MTDVERTAPEAPQMARSDAAPTPDARRPPAARPAARRRVSRRALRAWAWAAAGVSFVLPWAAFSAAPRPAASAHQVVVVPAGWRVVSVSGSPGTGGAVKVVAPGGKAAGSTTAPVATTGGSAPPP